MNTTSVTLLERLQRPDDREAWPRFVNLYTPLLYCWARRAGLNNEDAADLVQEVLTILVQKLPQFTYDCHKSFRGWLRTITLNKWRDFQRRRAIAPVAGNFTSDPESPDDATAFEEAEYQQHLVKRALQLMEHHFHPTTWKACWEYVMADKPALEVAQQLGITVNAVYLAKSRVLTRLRHELQGLLD